MNRLTYTVFLSECQKRGAHELYSKECCFTGDGVLLFV